MIIENKFFKKMTLDELIIFAKTINYIPPDKDIDEWSDDECSFGSLAIALKNPVQIKSFKGICKMLPPLTLIFKQRLKNYIKMFYNNTNNINTNTNTNNIYNTNTVEINNKI